MKLIVKILLVEKGERRMKKVLVLMSVIGLSLLAIAATQLDSRVSRSQDLYVEVCATLTSDGSGDASLVISNINGVLYRMVTSPASGASSPTANWDLTLIDDNANFPVDVLQGHGMNRSQSATEATSYSAANVLVGNYTLTGANMGNAKTAYVQLIYGK